MGKLKCYYYIYNIVNTAELEIKLGWKHKLQKPQLLIHKLKIIILICNNTVK